MNDLGERWGPSGEIIFPFGQAFAHDATEGSRKAARSSLERKLFLVRFAKCRQRMKVNYNHENALVLYRLKLYPAVHL